MMRTTSPKLQFLRSVTMLLGVLLLTLVAVNAQDTAWPQFRGPESNPVGTHARLAERWSQTENVEWSQEIPDADGLHQSSPPAKSI